MPNRNKVGNARIYERAVTRGIPRLIFLIDKDHLLKISNIEIEAADKLHALKERLKAERVVSFFKSPEDILITSRLDQPNFVPVPLDLLNSELSFQLLIQEAGQSPSAENELKAAKEISEKLGGLPLALELAGAYLRHRPIGWVCYRDLLNQNLKAALPAKFLSGSFTRHESDI